MRKYSRPLCSLLLLLAIAGPIAPVAAAGSNISGAVTQSYNADGSVLPGMVVETKTKDQATVTPLTAQDIRNMLGVVVPTGDSAIVLTPQSAPARQVLVAPFGSYNLLVSNQDGPIKSGDYLTVSSLPGISMKAGTSQSEIVGRAAGSFNGVNNVISTVSLKGSAGNSTNVSIGQVLVNVRLAPNPLFRTNNLPGFLSKAANNVADRPGSIRIYLSAIVLLATFFISGMMFYSSARSSITAIGRNPLAKRAIGRKLVESLIAGLVIFLSGVLAAYLILI